MSPLLLLALCSAILCTSFLSGIFGMAGGMILIGIMLTLMRVPDAMILHGVTQMASNGWRGLLWIRYVRWQAVIPYVTGCTIAILLWSLTEYVPSKPVAFFMLGVTPLLPRLASARYRPDPNNAVQGLVYGVCCMMLLLLTGVAGPLVDTFFLGGNLDRRQIVASKAISQIFGHAAKLLYFGVLVDQGAALNPVFVILAVVCSMVGTMLAARVLLAMTDHQYRTWANRLITGIAGYYIVHGTVLAVFPAVPSP